MHNNFTLKLFIFILVYIQDEIIFKFAYLEYNYILVLILKMTRKKLCPKFGYSHRELAEMKKSIINFMA